MTMEEFKEWKKKWYKTVPRCDDFVCCHELTACGVDYLCGDCTIYETWKLPRYGKVTCTDVGCEDCFEKYSCKRGRQRRGVASYDD